MLNYMIKNLAQIFICKNTSYNLYKICIPTDIVLRTELICNYICTEEDCDFDLESFLYLLYNDFIKQCVEHYNPKKVLKKITTNYINDKTLIITNGYDKEILHSDISYHTYSIEFDSECARNGQLILNELKELYHVSISFESLIAQIWISFIYDYKTGDNLKAFAYLKKLLDEY